MFITSSRRIELRDGKNIVIIKQSDKAKEYSDDLKTLPFFQSLLKDGIIKYDLTSKSSPIVKKETKKEIKKEEDTPNDDV